MVNHEVSVLIPAYNAEKTLRQCLRSVLDQTFDDYEVVVVDNNSTDGTKDIIMEAARRDSRVKYVFEACHSRGAARNATINAASGNILVMTDADCTVPMDWVQRMTEPIIRGREDAVMGFQEDLVGNYWTRNIQKSDCEFLSKRMSGDHIGHLDTKNFAIKKDVMSNLMFDPRLENMEDLDLYFRLKGRVRILFLPSVAVGHRHKTSLYGIIRVNFDRGYWTKVLYEKNKSAADLRGEAMVESVHLNNLLIFPFCAIKHILSRPPRESVYMLACNLPWRAGIIYASLDWHLKLKRMFLPDLR